MSAQKLYLNQPQLQIINRLLLHEVMYLENRKSNITEFPKTDPLLQESLHRWNSAIDEKVAELNELRELIEQEIKP